MLACWSIAHELQLDRVVCYTFGAPRPGNAAFAKSYNLLIPDTWNVINDRLEILAIKGMPQTYTAYAKNAAFLPMHPEDCEVYLCMRCCRLAESLNRLSSIVCIVSPRLASLQPVLAVLAHRTVFCAGMLSPRQERCSGCTSALVRVVRGYLTKSFECRKCIQLRLHCYNLRVLRNVSLSSFLCRRASLDYCCWRH